MANTTLTPSRGRQYPLYAEVSFTFGNVADTGVAVPAIKLPPGAVVIDGAVIVDTVFNTGTSIVLDVGDSTTGNRYKNDADLKSSTGVIALVPTGYVSDGADILVTPTIVGAAATTGAARLWVAYVIQGRTHEVQTN